MVASLTRLKVVLKRVLPPAAQQALASWRRQNGVQGDVCFGDLSGCQPISDEFGYDRGTPIDRGYIEAFLERWRSDIKGRVLEVGDDAYSRRFGGARVSHQDVLHINPEAPEATIVGDLGTPDVLPQGAFDCLVLTQTLHLIYDMRTAVGEMHRALKPGGIALVTVPGITRIDRGEWGNTWFWSLTELSARRVFADVFGPANVEVEQRGNVYAATAFLQGLALEEVDREKLDELDPCFPVIIAVRAQKAPR